MNSITRCYLRYATLNVALVVALVAPHDIGAATIQVPTDQPTIQAAINAASNGDTVQVAPGTYTENINFSGKAITVTSTGGPQVTTINGGGAGSVVTFSTSEKLASVLNGFTITNGTENGSTNYNGGGILIESASPTLTGNVITGNNGNGVYVGFSSALIQGNTITNNSGCAGPGGGGLYIGGTGSAQIIGNTISNNTCSEGSFGGGILLWDAGTPTIQNNIINGNTVGGEGGGIGVVNDEAANIVQNVIFGNVAGFDGSGGGGGGVYCSVPDSSRGCFLVNNTITNNSSGMSPGSEVALAGFDSEVQVVNNIIMDGGVQTELYCDTTYSETPPIVTFNDVFNSSTGSLYGGSCDGDAGTNENVSVNPLFLNSTQNNFHLQFGSQVIGAGSISAPDLPTTDLDGNPRIQDATVDMGAYEFFPTTVTVAPPRLAFGDQALGTTSSDLTVTVTNTGANELLLAIVISGDFSQTNNCGTTVAAGLNCSINVSFSPTVRGALSGNLTITSNASSGPNVVTLTGTGTEPVVSLSSPPTFPSEPAGTTSPSQTVKVTNTGNASLIFTAIGVTGPFAITASGTTCSTSSPVAASGSCTVAVTFTPIAGGTASGSLSFGDNAPNSPQTVSLSGTGTVPVVSLSAPPTFPSEPTGTTSPSQTVTVTNTGKASLIFTAIGVTGPFAITASGTTCSTSSPVAASGSCTVAVTFTPIAGGTASGSLSFSDNAPNSPQTVALNGMGQDFLLAAASGSSTSATVTPGQPASYTLSMAGEGGMSGTVAFTCAVVLYEATCTVSPNPATAGSSATNVTVTVTTVAPSFSAPLSRPLPPVAPLSPGLMGLVMLAWALAAMAWAMMHRNQSIVSRCQSTLALLAGGLLLTLALVGCGGGGGGGGGTPPNPGTPAGTYTVTVTGTTSLGSAALSHNVTLSLTVS